MPKLRYSDYASRIDVDALEEELSFEVLDRNGDEDRGHCLFPQNHQHGDTTGKMSINRDLMVYNCWVCGGGSLLSLAMETQGLDVDDATHWLHNFTRDQQSDEDFLDEFERDLMDIDERIETLPYFNNRVLDKWLVGDHEYEGPPILDTAGAVLVHPGDKATCVFRQKWGITPNIVRKFGLGYDPHHKRSVKGEVYEGQALIFPHFWQGRLVGWQERWLDDDRPRWVPKYTNTNDLPRKTTVFNYDNAVQRSAELTYVVESVPSALALLSCGQNAVATFGSEANPAQLRLLRRLNGGVILCPDGDKPSETGGKPAGEKWRDNLTRYLERYIEVYHLDSPAEGTDIADVVASSNVNDVLAYVASNLHHPLDD